MWSSLAALAASTRGIPPFELLAVTFGVACVTGLAWLWVSAQRPPASQVKTAVGYLLTTTLALFSYHALYFKAMALAPPAKVSLIAYLWPLFIVVFSSFSSGRHARLWSITGVLLGLAATALLALPTADPQMGIPTRTSGLIAAFGCAVIWSSYSILNRRFREMPSYLVILACGGVAVAGAGAHWMTEGPTVVPTLLQWAAILALGIGPVGIAFVAWDYGTKHGNLSALGALSYSAPVLSSLLLVLLGYTPGSPRLAAACVLVTAGAWIATRAMRPNPQPATHLKQELPS
jgi:drug/metabolite transporter (DMT)-like permease